MVKSQGISSRTSSPTTWTGYDAGLDPRVVGPRPVGQPEPPVVPRAGDDPVLDVAAGQRRPGVRAPVVDRVVLAAVVEDGHVLAADLDHDVAALRDLPDLGHRHQLSHADLAFRLRERIPDPFGWAILPRNRPRSTRAGDARSRSQVPGGRLGPRCGRQLAAWGAVARPAREDTDHYFNAPDRDFAQTDEAFRLRRIGTGELLTYKGPKRDADTKTRTEVELRLADGAGRRPPPPSGC